MYTGSPAFSFAAIISGVTSFGTITRIDGQTVEITQADMPDLLLDLAADGSGMPGRAKYHALVLGEWFARKRAVPKPPHLRMVG